MRFAKTDGADAKSQCLDVYAPVGGEGHPIIVWLHGGGMKGGDKAQAGITCGEAGLLSGPWLCLREEDPAFLSETKTSAALDVVCRLASDQAHNGRQPLGPRGWGEMLALLASRDSSPEN